MAELDPKILKKTQESLGGYFKKPPLTEKLLSRPPFRFLHDIITSLISNNGFMKGLFTDDELKSENIKDKAQKSVFLEKIIDMVSLVLKKRIDVKASSIIAGKEPEKTNDLLQSLGKAINMKVDNATYVSKTLAGEAKNIGHKSTSQSKTSKTLEVKRKSSVDETANKPPKSHDKETSQVEQKPKKSKEHSKSDSNKKSSKESRIMDESSTKTEKNTEAVVTEEPVYVSPIVSHETLKVDHDEDNFLNETNIQNTEFSTKLQRPSSAKGSRHKHEIVDDKMASDNYESDNRQLLNRPPSARPAPPKVKKSSETAISENFNVQSKVSGLIVDADQDSDGDYIVEEYVGGGEVDTKLFKNDNEEEHGLLVQKIIESKKEFIETENTGVTSQYDIHRKRERHNVEKDIEKKINNLQNVTKCIHPLGKLIDFIQEDIDAMQKEAIKWQDEKNEFIRRYLSEKNITDKLVKPLLEKINEQNYSKMDYENAIAKMKTKISDNTKKIELLLLNSCSTT